jgi:hypothetical protein
MPCLAPATSLRAREWVTFAFEGSGACAICLEEVPRVSGAKIALDARAMGVRSTSRTAVAEWTTGSSGVDSNRLLRIPHSELERVRPHLEQVPLSREISPLAAVSRWHMCTFHTQASCPLSHA